MRNPALYYFAGTVLVALVATVLLCRHRIAQKKKSFFITSLAITIITNTIFFVVIYLVGRIYAEGWHVFTLEAWRSDNGRLHNLESAMFDARIFIVVGTLICILPALGIAYYYARRSRKNERQVA
jgi:hypothetical protein